MPSKKHEASQANTDTAESSLTLSPTHTGSGPPVRTTSKRPKHTQVHSPHLNTTRKETPLSHAPTVLAGFSCCLWQWCCKAKDEQEKKHAFRVCVCVCDVVGLQGSDDCINALSTQSSVTGHWIHT